MTDLHRLHELLSSYRFAFSDEDELQSAIEAALHRAGLDFEREARLDARDRPDFLVGDAAIEVKVAGSSAQVHRQLLRYAAHERVRSVLLVTTRSRHQLELPESLLSKPLSVLHVGGVA
jgi:hypothetical protein